MLVRPRSGARRYENATAAAAASARAAADRIDPACSARVDGGNVTVSYRAGRFVVGQSNARAPRGGALCRVTVAGRPPLVAGDKVAVLTLVDSLAYSPAPKSSFGRRLAATPRPPARYSIERSRRHRGCHVNRPRVKTSAGRSATRPSPHDGISTSPPRRRRDPPSTDYPRRGRGGAVASADCPRRGRGRAATPGKPPRNDGSTLQLSGTRRDETRLG